jgi:hypothetical protein
MLDDSPDTSYLGKYTSRIESDYTIDRRHSQECAVQHNNPQTKQTIDKLERIIYYLDQIRLATDDELEQGILEESEDKLIELQDEVAECDCGGRFIERNSFEYFEPNHENYKGCTEEEIRTYCRQDFERMERLNAGDWCYLGIRAEAEIQLNATATWENSVVSKVSWHEPIAPYQTITSGGLYGIESDSDDSYFAEVESDELAELRGQLKALGFSTRAISAAFKDVQHKEE